jgi:tetratricopeptide (TPR) repeat protein
MEDVESYAVRAVVAAREFIEGPASEQIPDEQKAAIMADVHVTLGAVRFYIEDFAAAAAEYRSAIEFVPNDAVAYYMLGLASNNSQNVDVALSALARAVYLELPGSQARDNLERVYQVRHGSLDGLEEFIAAEGQQVGPN